ncbi:MAG: tetratricopeptide repeat protein [Alphaproteobacteria bacterium]|nr:tetratricopeptide repeat protein [Alphaproteobacteria bacterium]
MSRSLSRILAGGLLALSTGCLLSLPAWAASARDGQACLERADLQCAEEIRDALVRRGPADADTLALQVRTLFFEGDYDGAVAALDQLEAKGAVPKNIADAPIRETRDAATGFVEARGDGVVLRHAPGVDLVLRDEALDVMVRSRKTVDELLGGGPRHDILMDIFPDGKRFIAASGLPPEAVRTTGVIALSKWTRLLLTTPRALARGYAWKDTVAHEYIHLVVAWRTQDQAPVWLQEGLAKHLEGYWRGDHSGNLSIHQQSLLAEALRDDDFVPFEKFRYSMAYLDSGEEAAKAFGQVGTMVGFLVETKGVDALPPLLDAVRDGQDAQQAMAEAAGYPDFAAFTEGWKGYLSRLPLVQEQTAALPVVLDVPEDDYQGDPVLDNSEDLARAARVGDLLREAGRYEAALIEYDKALDPTEPPSPLILARVAQCHERMGDLAKALSEAEEAARLYPEFTLTLTTLARLYEAAGRTRDAVGAWQQAHDLNPFDPNVQTALADGYASLGDDERSRRHLRYARIIATGGVLPDAATSTD